MLAWDDTCDNIYQIDATALSYLAGAEIIYAPNSGVSHNYNNAIFYLSSTAKAYAFNAHGEAVIGSPAAMTGTTRGGLGHSLFVLAPRVNGTGVYYADVDPGPGADVLDLLDASTETFTRAVYTFTETTHVVRDMKVLRIPGLPVLSLR